MVSWFRSDSTVRWSSSVASAPAPLGSSMRQPELSGDFATIMGWADSVRRLGVRANADTPRDAETALSFGAEGIGLGLSFVRAIVRGHRGKIDLDSRPGDTAFRIRIKRRREPVTKSAPLKEART